MTRVLIIDDEQDVLESTQVLLELEGHDVRTGSDTRSILALVQQDPPDVLLQDVHMPGLDLAELIRSLREDGGTRHVVIVLFTAAPQPETLLEKWDADDVVRKPFEVEDLLAVLKKWENGRS